MNHHQLAKLGLGYISLLLDEDEVVDGSGESKHVSTLIAKFAEDVSEYCEYAKSQFPAGYQLYIPDFWHIAFGRAKCLTNEDGQLLWDAACFIHVVMVPMLAAGVVSRISYVDFDRMGIQVEHVMQGSLYRWRN